MQESDLNLDSLQSMLKSSDLSSRKLALGILKANQKKISKKDLVRLYKLVPAIECVKTYKDVCIQLGIKELTIEDYKSIPKSERLIALTTHKLNNICKRFNGGWKPNFSNYNQEKWIPYFDKNASGWVFLGSHVWLSCSRGVVGFYYKSKDDSIFCGQQFLSIYKDILK